MYGCFVAQPNDAGADLGVVFFHNEGYSTACGHGTIALVTWALESGRLPPGGRRRRGHDRRPVGAARVRRPMGRGGTAGAERPVPERPLVRPRAGRRDPDRAGRSAWTSAYGGAFYGSVDARALGLSVDRDSLPALIALQRELRPALDARARRRPSRTNRSSAGSTGSSTGRTSRRPGTSGAGTAQRDRLRRRRGRPLAVRQRHVRAARAPRRGGPARDRRDAPAPEHRRQRVRRSRDRGCGRRRTGGSGHGGGGGRPPERAPRLHARPDDPLGTGFLLR